MSTVNPRTGETIPSVTEVTGRRVRFVSGDEGVVQSAQGDGVDWPALDVLLDDGRVWTDVDAADVTWPLPSVPEARRLLRSVGMGEAIDPDEQQVAEATLVDRFGANLDRPVIAQCVMIAMRGFPGIGPGPSRTSLIEASLGMVAHLLDGEPETHVEPSTLQQQQRAATENEAARALGVPER